MSPSPRTIQLPPAGAGEVIVLEAYGGAQRRDLLRRWAQAQQGAGVETWLLPCDVDEAGIWAGLNAWIASLLPRIEAEAPELMVRHDSELLAVLPELRRRITPRYPTLTETAPPGEAVRNYAMDRGYRIGHGLIELLAEWHRHTGAGRWVLACDGYGARGALVGRCFAELMRRRGAALGITLLAACEPGEGDAVAASFHPGTPVHRAAAGLAADPPSTLLPETAGRQAVELERAVLGDPLETRLHLHELIALWIQAGFPERAAAWQAWGLGAYDHLGYYEDALRYAHPVRECLRDFRPELHFYSRWNLVGNVFNAYMANGLLQEAVEVLHTEGLEKLSDPESLARAHYMVAMLHVRYLPERNLALGEWHLGEALRRLAEAGPMTSERHFLTVFMENGMALVRHRQGRPDEAIRMTNEGFHRLSRELPPDQHRLHRSVLLYNAGQVYASTGALDDAVRSFSAAMEMDPYYSEYYNDRGNVFLKLGRYDDAVRDYLEAIEYSSPYAEVWVNLGQCYALMGRWGEAEAAYARALDLDPGRFLAHAGRAKTLSALGRVDEAVAEYDLALALEPEHALLYANRASLHFRAGRFDASLADLDVAVRGAPGTGPLYRNRALALRALGRADEAADDLERYLECSPDAADREQVRAEAGALRGLLQAA